MLGDPNGFLAIPCPNMDTEHVGFFFSSSLADGGISPNSLTSSKALNNLDSFYYLLSLLGTFVTNVIFKITKTIKIICFIFGIYSVYRLLV